MYKLLKQMADGTMPVQTFDEITGMSREQMIARWACEEFQNLKEEFENLRKKMNIIQRTGDELSFLLEDVLDCQKGRGFKKRAIEALSDWNEL